MNLIKRNYSLISNLPKLKYSKLQNRNDLTIILLYIFGGIIYSISLCHLSGVEMRCFFWNGAKCYYSIFILVFISSILTSISIYIILFLNYKKNHIIIIFINRS